MSSFLQFKKVVQEQFDRMSSHELFRTSIDKDGLWETYLSSFQEGTNPIFRERTEHDCQCCKQFIKACGNVVAIIDNKKVSIWDIDIAGQYPHYQIVADAMSALVKSQSISNVFLHTDKYLGTDKNRELSAMGDLLNEWNHFHYELPDRFVVKGVDIGITLSDKRSAKDVFKRGLSEITIESINTVIELIDQNSLYRGHEHKESVVKFLKEKVEFDKLVTAEEKELFSWMRSVSIGGLSRLRNSVVGTLLVDLSEGVDLEWAVKSFETKVAPTNYKRPTALITKSMIDQAQKKVEELGIADSLARRFATTEDVTVNNIIFVDREVKKEMNVFDKMAGDVPVKIDKLAKVAEIGINDFIKDILPKLESIEILFENSKQNNLMSLIAPQNVNAKRIFKWENNFSWSYNGEVTDSIKERVKKAGGNIDAELRFSIQWNDGDDNQDDFDAHCQEPTGYLIHYPIKGERQPSSGMLDVDIINPGTEVAVENITYINRSKMPKGDYTFLVHNYTDRGGITGFTAQIEFDNQIFDFAYDKRLRQSEKVQVAIINFDGANFTIKESLKSSFSSKEVWGISTNRFQKVRMIMNSPNYWNGNGGGGGNKHWFFILGDCKNPKEARGFYNEFLNNELTPHRKVFEVMSSKMKAKVTDSQLSGLGFSSTQRNHVICKVSGSFSRTIKIIF